MPWKSIMRKFRVEYDVEVVDKILPSALIKY